MEERALIRVSLPRESPTTAYWQEPPSSIASLRSSEYLPPSADIVIIGSGISGASVAHHLLSESPTTKVVMLEARTACSGATGRNGGHTKAASYLSFLTNVQRLGVEEAIKITRFQLINIRATHAFARDQRIQCDSRHIDSVDIFYHQPAFAAAIEAINSMKVVMEPHEASARHIVFGAEEARERFLTPDAIGAVQYEAGSISAYRFTTGVLKLALEKGLNLQTTTPATKIRYRAEVSSNEGRWVIDTPRGGISTEQVVLATNGYSASLWPQVQGVIVPMRGQITAQRPGESMPSSGLGKTYSFIHGDGYDYMVPQPAGSRYPNDLVVGGGLRYAANEGLYEYGETDDTVHNKDISEYLTDSLVDFFGVNWGRDDLDGRIRKEWTGIMGYSPDGHPLVGEMPGQRGLYISAAFNGNGMTLCLLCAKALKDMMLGHDKRELDSWFPKPYRVSQDRLQMRYAGKPKLVQGEALEVRANT